MSWTRLVAAASLAALSLPAQDAPRLPVEEVPLSAANLGIVSSIAADSRGNIYVLQRGDKADPVIVVNRKGELLRSWGKGMFTVPHSVRVDPAGNVWTVDAGNSVLMKFSPEGKKLAEISVGEVATGQNCAFPTLCETSELFCQELAAEIFRNPATVFHSRSTPGLSAAAAEERRFFSASRWRVSS